MRRRLSSMLMVFVVLSLALSAVSVVAPSAEPASAQGGPTGGLNSWVRHDLPTTLHWQMAPNTDIWDLTAANDGTLFALVEDTSGPEDITESGAAAGPAPCAWDGLRWAVFPAWSDVSLFKSTDGGYTWTLMWHQPASDAGAPLAVVPQPGYVEGNSGNDVVFIATGTRFLSPSGPGFYVGGPQEGNLYRSMDGGDNFTRVTPRNPSVTLVNGGTITCLDVAENILYPGTYMAIVGTSSLRLGGMGEGVFTWNEDNDRDWRDQMIANALPPAPFPGSMPAGNGLDVIAVLASPTYTEDGTFMAVVNDLYAVDPAGSAVGIYVCYWDHFDGTWGGDVDSPTTARIVLGVDYAWAACMAVGDDFTQVVNNYVFVGLDGTIGNNDVWRIQGLSTVTGPSRATATMLGAGRISDIMVQGPAASGAAYVGCELPVGAGPGTGQAQVLKGTQATLWPQWTPSFKPPSGRWPTFVTDMSGTVMAAGGGDGFSYGGVHRAAAGCEACTSARMVFNGVGLLDDIAVSEDIPGFVNNDMLGPAAPGLMYGTSWCLAEAHAEEISPTFETDKLMYVSTYSRWDADNVDIFPPATGLHPEAGLSLWRWTDGIHWERIMKEYVTLPTSLSGGVGNDQFRGKAWQLSGLAISTSTVFTWWPRVPRGFSEDPYVFLLGGRGASVSGWQQEMLWYSPDKGDTWIPFDQMPIGAATGGVPVPGLSETGWWVEDNNTIFCGNVAGWVYKTADRGASWTEGALTAAGLEVTSIVTSPIYSETGSSDKCVLVGTFDPSQPGGGLGAGDTQHEIWLSQDGAEQDLENVGAEICTAPTWSGTIGATATADLSGYGLTVVNFDPGWETNRMVYSTASTWLDLWQLVGTGSTELTRIDSSDVGVYRTEVNLNEPSASTWEQVWDADDFNAIAPEPQPVEGMMPSWITFRYAFISDLQIGQDGTMYVPFAVYDFSRNFNSITLLEKAPSPHGPGRFTAGGVLRCLEPTQAVTEWDVIDKGLGEWDGLFLNRAPVGDSNTLISLTWDFQEWRWKLAIYDDTLSGAATGNAPTADSTGVGNIVGNKVSVALDWADLDADVYQWQVDNDCGFVAPVIKEGNTTETLVTVTGLDPNVKYCWRVRALEPALSRWSDAQDFNTIMSADLNAPQLLSPKAGAALVEKKPVFQWSAIGWADQYQLQVATDNGFATAALVIDETLLGNTQAYQSPDELEDGTYYWRVKAMSDTQDAWSSTGIFSVGGKAAGGGVATWVWVLIVIGVILLLVMTWILLVRLRVKN